MHVTVMGDSNEQNIVPRADEEIISVDVSGVVRKFPSFSLDVSCPLCSHTQDPFLPHSQESQNRVPTEERDENRFPIRARGYSPPRGDSVWHDSEFRFHKLYYGRERAPLECKAVSGC